MTAVHTLTFRDDGLDDGMREPLVRMTLVAELVRAVGATEEDGLVALPAGFVQAPSVTARDQWAEGLLAASRDAGVGLVFGIDVADEERWGIERCPRSFAFACERGQRLLWASPTARNRPGFTGRAVTFGALRTVVLLGRELFHAGARSLVDEKRPDLVLVMGHGGATAKWIQPLAALEALAPMLLVHQALPQRRPVWTGPPRGWRATKAAGPLQVLSYRREAVGATLPVVGN